MGQGVGGEGSRGAVRFVPRGRGDDNTLYGMPSIYAYVVFHTISLDGVVKCTSRFVMKDVMARLAMFRMLLLIYGPVLPVDNDAARRGIRRAEERTYLSNLPNELVTSRRPSLPPCRNM